MPIVMPNLSTNYNLERITIIQFFDLIIQYKN